MYWEARAEYLDGTSVERLFEYNERENENKQQFEIENWLVSRHDGCTWYSVDIVFEDKDE